MILYPYSSPIILTDVIFISYGGETGTSTANQRSAAYLGAEVEMSGYIGTYLLPTGVTGTFPYPIQHQPIMLEHTYLQGVDKVIIKDADGTTGKLVDSAGLSWTFDNTWGYVHVGRTANAHSCANYLVEIAYRAGLPSGTSYNPLMLESLTALADTLLKDMYDPYALEGGVGDPGISRWSDLGHSETRDFNVGRQSSLGTSPRAIAAMRRVGHLVKTKRALRF